MADEQFDDTLFEDQEYDENLFEDESPVTETPTVDSDAPSVGESFLAGAQAGTTLGFKEEIGAAAGTAGYALGRYDFDLADIWSHRGELLEKYKELKGKEKQESARHIQTNPYAYGGAELITSLAIPAGGVAALSKADKAKKAITTLRAGQKVKGVKGLKETADHLQRLEKLKTYKKLKQAKAAAGFGTIGGVYGAGYSEADLSSGKTSELKEFVKDTLGGAVLGVALPPALSKVGQKIKKSLNVERLKQEAEKGILSSTNAPKSVIKKELLNSKEGFKGVGRALLGNVNDDQGKKVPIMSFIDSPEIMGEKLEEALLQNREKIAPVFNRAQERIDQAAPELADTVGILTDKIENIMVKHGEGLLKQFGGEEKYIRLLTKAQKFIESNPNLSGYSLHELGKIKTQLGQQLSPKQWSDAITSGAAIPEEKELIKDLYHAVKTRIEDLADKVSKPGEKLGQEIKELNSKYSNLLDAKTIAEFDQLRASKGPQISYKDFILPSVLGVATGPGVGAALYAGMFLIEKKTGRKLGQLASMANAKGIDKLAKTVERVQTPEAIRVSKQIRDLLSQPLNARSGKLVQILKEHEDLTDIKLEDSAGVDTKYTKLGDLTNHITSLEGEQVMDLSNQLEEKLGSEHIYIKNLQRISKIDNRQQRQRALDALSKQPGFRELLQTSEE